MACQANVSMSRRNLVAAGLVGAVASGMAAWGALPAMADQAEGQAAAGTAAAVDLAALSDDELVALEARVAQEKSTRGINSAPLPAGRYTTGTDFDAGTYVLTPTDLTVEWKIYLYESAEKLETGSGAWFDAVYVEPGKSATVSMSGAQILSTDTDCTIAPFQKLTFGQSTDDASAQAATDASADQAVASADSGEVTPEFKELMDGYEAFMNSYCDFMKTYADTSNSGDMAALSAMLGDYSTLMQQEVEWLDKIDAVDQSTLSAADLNYYIEVTTRVSQRLIEVSGSL